MTNRFWERSDCGSEISNEIIPIQANFVPGMLSVLPGLKQFQAFYDKRPYGLVDTFSCCCLGDMGPVAQQTVPQLIDMLQDKNEWVCRNAA